MEQLRLKLRNSISPSLLLPARQERRVGVNAFTTTDQTQYIASYPPTCSSSGFPSSSEQLFRAVLAGVLCRKGSRAGANGLPVCEQPGRSGLAGSERHCLHRSPYRNPVIGWKSDMERYSTRDAMEGSTASTKHEPHPRVFVWQGS